ncbi:MULTISPECIES: hypothetical protein [unclassified Lentimicrobium]|uniref:hypothetical protein n=1 Tax=unclassified Lentimicrobium TaxID=2677434 RepID=UPI001554492E|nr:MULTISPECIES: hypothetical protein [unclassified Lentimicrobium]NPD44635.1 hypothetical protein [Lentimicrobium sp. S6]NPD83347.1 hypothetical protein [Lentimicrobium sp. L6]
MKSIKYLRVFCLSFAMIILFLGFGCQSSPLAPDDDLVQHLQTLSDSSSLKKQKSPDKDQLTTEDLDALRGHSLEGSSSNKSVNLPPMVGYILVGGIIIGFALLFYFVVFKRIKDGIGDLSYQIKNAKDRIEDTFDQKVPEDYQGKDKEQIEKLLDELKKFDKNS